MSPAPTSPAPLGDDAVDAPFDAPVSGQLSDHLGDPLSTQLRAHWASDTEPADNGFTERVLAALPSLSPPLRRGGSRNPHGVAPARAAGLTAMAVAMLALALLPGEGLGGLEQVISMVALLALLTWWSLPQSRGSLWR